MTFYLEKIGKINTYDKYNTIFIKGYIDINPSFDISFPYYFDKDNIDTIIDEFMKEFNIKKITEFSLFKNYLSIFTKKTRFYSIEFL